MINKIKDFFKRNYKNIITGALFLPPILVSIVSMSHLIVWFKLSNYIVWAAWLGVAIEVAAIASLAAIVTRVGRGTLYFIFFAMTLLQFIGNSYYHFDYMMEQLSNNPEYLDNWVIFTKSIFEMLFLEVDKTLILRWTALFKGFWIPAISLSFLHVLVKRFDSLYKDKTVDEKEDNQHQQNNDNEEQENDDQDVENDEGDVDNEEDDNDDDNDDDEDNGGKKN